MSDNLIADANEWNTHEMWYLPGRSDLLPERGRLERHHDCEGVNVAGFDLLDYMAMDPPPAFPEIEGGNY